MYYLLSIITRLFLAKLRKYHKDEEQLLVFSRDFIGEDVYAYGVYEKNEINTIIAALDFDTKKENAIDIGANIGNHAVQFSKHFNNIYCFEPNKTIFDVLTINTRNKKNVHLNHFGLSNIASTSYLNIPNGNFGGASVTDVKGENTIDINLKIGDDVITESFALVKIDVEGHEATALDGMKKVIENNKPIICFELFKDPKTRTELLEKLNELGYHKFYVPQERGFFLTKNSTSFTASFVNGLFFKQKPYLMEVKNFKNKLYNLVLCEHESSTFKIKKANIK